MAVSAADGGSAVMARGDDAWLRAYGLVVATLPRVEALAAASRARLEAVNTLQHDFWEARDALLQHRLLQAEESRRRWEAAYVGLQRSGDDRKFAELQGSDFEDFTTFVDVLAAENKEFQIKVKEVDAGAEHGQITRDLEAELRELKQAYEAICSEKDKEIHQLQVASQKKDVEIHRLQAQAKAAGTKGKLCHEDKLLEVHYMPEKIDGETEKHKGKQCETNQMPKKDMSNTQKIYCSEGPTLRGGTKTCPSKQMLADRQPETTQKRKFGAFLSDGEELALDYNAPKKCFYGTAKSRGYIGGDISASGIIAKDEAESEHFEPMVTYKDAEEMLGNAYCSHDANPNIVEHETSTQREDSKNCPPATPDSEPQQQTAPILFDISEPNNSMEAWSTQDAEGVTRTPVHVSRTIESSLQQFPVYGTQPLEFSEKIPNTINELTAPNMMNTSSSHLGSSLVPGFDAKENSLKYHRNVKPPIRVDNEHTLGVEGRLNSLLDQDGGISSRQDSTYAYLRLLIVISADDDGTSKSIRDVALILEALLQTKSGDVLLDIINLNGLQMLHNILKQNRDHFIRRPIIRKLLKVFEFLASRGILTAEKINEVSQFPGRESFRDAMLKLTRHSDKQVHPIAQRFCAKWILPYMDGPANCGARSYSSRRKRKSRWD